MQYIIAVDVGTTTIRACLYDDKCRLVDVASDKIQVEISGNGELRVEIDPDVLFDQFIQALNVIGAVLYFLTRNPRFKAARMLKFLSSMVSHRVMVTIQQSMTLKNLLELDKLDFGCLETWLLWRLTDGNVHIAEASNCSSTGMFDPFINDYNMVILRIMGFPTMILPQVVDSANHARPLGHVAQRLFSRNIPIYAVLADQQSALYGSGGWRRGDVKISLGTGTFVDMNTGSTIHASMTGLYPLVAWRVENEPVFVAEGNNHATAVVLKWAESIGLFSNVAEISDLARTVPDSNGVLFIPAFGGRIYMVRAILESIAFRVYQILETMHDEVGIIDKPRIRICGGVAANDFICQTIATLTGVAIERMKDVSYVACRGVALLAGYAQGACAMFKDELMKLSASLISLKFVVQSKILNSI
ncbi:unnamed protein product [Angiostrongylus costaricensis]|uniref:FGGY_N domain-containing protein n=1 Tax=Angiostrongylus costaricensis TaxID=334426 RepID=A0A158PLG1_ANGCS|nr:unnamed protein product [Angiostrongylus costaricensis]